MNGAAIHESDDHDSSVAVGIDGSNAAIHAAEWAVDEAVSREVPLRLVYVISARSEPAPFAAVGNESMEREYGETALAMASAAVEAVGKPVKIETAMLHGDPASELVAVSRNVSTICVGSTGIGRISKMFLGSTAMELAEASQCSVAIIRSPQSRKVSGRSLIAVSVEASAGNGIVVRHAMEEARRRDLPLLAIGAWRRDVGEMSAAEIERRMRLWRSRYPDIELHTASTHSDVADFLAVFDRQIALAVLGSDDTDQITRLIGPQRHPVIGSAECSVLIVRASPYCERGESCE